MTEDDDSTEVTEPKPEPLEPVRHTFADADPPTIRTTDWEPVVLVTRRELKHLRAVVWGLAAFVVVLVVALGITIPRSVAYGDLFGENLDLRQRLAEIDRRMADVDRLLLRLRLYDAQLRSLAPEEAPPVVVDGEHGPLTEEDWESFSRVRPLEEATFVGDVEEEVASHPLRPAEAWAEAVEGRIDTFLSTVRLAEPNLTQVMSELEDLRALEQALPSTWPALGRLTSGFGWRRSPFGRTWRFHSGIDISDGRRGSPIVAPAAGRVLRAGYNSGYGRMVEIDHGFGITTIYGHCNSLSVEKGDVVDKGDPIATIGSTGRSTGPHLHFEVRLDGHPVDPLDYLPR